MAELRAIYNVRGPAGTAGGTGPGLPVAGTTGQVPKKNSVADFDIDWSTLVAADISDFDAAAVAANAATSTADRERANHTGTQSADTLTDGTTNKAFLATERTKLTGIATSATANDTDANLKARANHTGTQLAATISDFDTASLAANDSGLVTVTAANAAAAGFIAQTDWSITGSILVRTIGKSVQILFQGLTYTGAGITVPTDGKITNSNAVLLPTAYRTGMSATVLTGGASGRAGSWIQGLSGQVALSAVAGSVNIVTNYVFSCGGTYFKP